MSHRTTTNYDMRIGPLNRTREGHMHYTNDYIQPAVITSTPKHSFPFLPSFGGRCSKSKRHNSEKIEFVLILDGVIEHTELNFA